MAVKTHLEMQRHFARAAASAFNPDQLLGKEPTEVWSLFAEQNINPMELQYWLGQVLEYTSGHLLQASHQRKISQAQRREARERRDRAVLALRESLLGLKKLAEAVFGVEEGRHYFGFSSQLPNVFVELGDIATMVIDNLRDPSRPVPKSLLPLSLDKSRWADDLEKLMIELEQASYSLNLHQEDVKNAQVQREHELERLDRWGRAAWLMLKGLYLFQEEDLALEQLNRIRRSRRKNVQTKLVPEVARD